MTDEEAPRPRSRRRRWGLALLGALVLVPVGYLGGVATTSMWPITAQTEHFQAEIRLSTLPAQQSTLHSPTVFGDIDVAFTGPLPAPGIEARVQVKEELTDVLSQRPVSVDALAPAPEELDATVRKAIGGLGARFAGGVLITDALVLGLFALGRRSRPSGTQILASSLAAVLAVGAPALSAQQTYRQENLESFTTTSLLGTVRSNSGLFTNIRSQAQAATPYVQNLLALSQALQEQFVPPEVTGPAAARFLLVSDIHGMNYYPLMQQIVQDEEITAVIDTGDLLNFGSVAEGEMSGIFESIAALGVPYIFVRGNHDATSAEDEALLRRMEEIPNVILLEPTVGEFQEATVHGLTISGFNDTRYFGDDNEDIRAKQEPAVERYRAAFAERPLSDIVITHAPYGLESVETGGIRINGHMHSADREGNRIQVGTFTGGGLVSHFIFNQDPEEVDGELTGQPYAFDIAVFGQDCALQSLTRYNYRNLVSGEPVYDGLSVFNGDTIAEEVADDRSCSPDLGVTVETVDVPQEGEDAEEPGEPTTVPSESITPTTTATPGSG